MLIDFIGGIVLAATAVVAGCGWWSIAVFAAAFLIDVDIPINEFYRIFVKREKTFALGTLLDEYSYTHKRILHIPLVVPPLVFLSAAVMVDAGFATLIVLAILVHLVHDTMDQNFDGVPWLWPFDARYFKLRRYRDGSFLWEAKTSIQLRKEAEEMAKSGRTAHKILSDNLMR